MNILEILKKEVNKFLKDFHTVKKMNKTLHDLNVEIESITKTHTEENIDVKTLANHQEPQSQASTT